MTDDELDQIASAYVDGEATPEEVALVERDPDLAARVELFRQIQVNEPAIPPSGLADGQLAAAVAEFETLMAVGSPTETVDAREAAVSQQASPSPVIDLQEQAARRAERRSSTGVRTPSGPARPATRAFPSWLGAAAAVVVIAGGAVWAIGRAGSDQDEAAFDTSAAADSADEATDATEEALETAEADMDAASAAESVQDEAMEDEDAMEESAEEADVASDDADDAADDGRTAGDGEIESNFVGLAPVIVFDQVPDVDAIADLPEPETDLSLSFCGFEVEAPDLGEPNGFVPVAVAGQPAELFVFVDGDGSEVRLLVDGDCLPLEP